MSPDPDHQTLPPRSLRAECAGRARIAPERLKPLTYSVMHLIVAMGVAFALTRDWRVALGIGLIEPVVQTIAYTLHEAAWAKRLARRTR